MKSKGDDSISRHDDLRSRQDDMTSRQDELRKKAGRHNSRQDVIGNRRPVIFSTDTAPYLCFKLSGSSLLLLFGFTNSRFIHEQQEMVVYRYFINLLLVTLSTIQAV